MTKSRNLALLLVLATSAGEAMAQDPAALARTVGSYKRTFPPVRSLDCPEGRPGEVVVCARRDPDERAPERLPLPVERDPGAPTRGEGMTGTQVLNDPECFQRCPQPLQINMIGTAITAAKMIRKVIEEKQDD